MHIPKTSNKSAVKLNKNVLDGDTYLVCLDARMQNTCNHWWHPYKSLFDDIRVRGKTVPLSYSGNLCQGLREEDASFFSPFLAIAKQKWGKGMNEVEEGNGIRMKEKRKWYVNTETKNKEREK